MRSFVTCFFVAVAVLALSSCNNYRSQKDISHLWGALGATILDAIKKPDSVEYYKVAPTLPGAEIQKYEPSSTPIKLSDEETLVLQNLLLDDQNYIFNIQKKCVFVPDGAFLFKRGTSDIQVVISISCKQAKFIHADREIKLEIDPEIDNFKSFLQTIDLKSRHADAKINN